VHEYGCEQFGLTDFLSGNPEYNPIEEKQPDGTGIADFQDPTRGRIDKIPVSFLTDTAYAALIAALPVQNNFLQNLLGEKGIMGRCIYANTWNNNAETIDPR